VNGRGEGIFRTHVNKGWPEADCAGAVGQASRSEGGRGAAAVVEGL
jgi:hypothetical protein